MAAIRAPAGTKAVTTIQAVAGIQALTTVRAAAGPGGGEDDEDPPAKADSGVGNGHSPDDEGPDDDHGDSSGDGDRVGDADQDGGDGAEGRPVLPEVTAPLATLQRRAERPGETRLLGPLDPALTRDLATAAARSPHARWEITIVDDHGYATGHGIARPRRRRRQQPQPPGPASYALPARVNITITQTLLQPTGSASRAPAPRPATGSSHPGRPGTADGPWALTLPGGRELTVRFDVVPTHACDHRYQVNAYQPSERLRRLVQVRDHECTFPPCSRPAHESDFEHAIPYDKGGKTDACNAGARSRRCHQVKQLPRLDRHPAETRMACMDHAHRPDLHPGTLAVHRITTLGAARLE